MSSAQSSPATAGTASGSRRAQPRPLSTWQKVTFVLGNLGWSLGSYGVQNLLNYFYVPNTVDGEPMFPLFIRTGAVLLGLTIVGLVSFGGRLFDAVTDPLIAGISDRTRNAFGKRRLFMAVSGVPLAMSSVVVFLPPRSTGGPANMIWLAVSLLAFYLFFTMYMVTISAWVSELGHDSRARLDLATLSSVGWALGFGIGNAAYFLQGTFENAGAAPTAAFQYAMGIFAILSLVCLYLPVVFIQENQHVTVTTSTAGSFQAVADTLKDRNFVVFLGSQLCYWIALTFIQVGIAYIAVTLLDLDKSFASLAMTVLFAASFLFYVPVNVAARKLGKKKVLVAAYIGLSLVYLFTMFAGRYSMSGAAQGLIIAVAAALPIAVFTIIPFAMIADLADARGRATGNYQTGMYYAVRGLVMKGGIAVSNLLFPTLVLWGGTRVTEFGVRATAVAALVACVIGALVIWRWYHE